MKHPNTLREAVKSCIDTAFYQQNIDNINFELNHLELHDLDDYLLTCFKKGIKDESNEGNSNIKYLLDMTSIAPVGPVETKGGNFPDIDLDFEHEKRHLVKQHLRDHYGEDKVASIGTFGLSKAKGIFKDVARAYGLDFKLSNDISKLFPEMCSSISEALEESPDLVEAIGQSEQVSQVIEYASKLEGTVRNVGIHAAGVVVTACPVTDLVPLFASKGEPVTMVDGDALERVGLIKP